MAFSRRMRCPLGPGFVRGLGDRKPAPVLIAARALAENPRIVATRAELVDARSRVESCLFGQDPDPLGDPGGPWCLENRLLDALARYPRITKANRRGRLVVWLASRIYRDNFREHLAAASGSLGFGPWARSVLGVEGAAGGSGYEALAPIFGDLWSAAVAGAEVDDSGAGIWADRLEEAGHGPVAARLRGVFKL